MGIKDSNIFQTRESTLTFALVSFEAVLICILEGMVIKNHLQLVANCSMDLKGQGKYLLILLKKTCRS
jgi:hypothetical protein